MSLEIKKKQTELLRVQAARAELELKIMEREQDIERLRDAIKIQTDKEAELTESLKTLKGE